ncbi:MAG: hypothetical protein LBQ30_07465 [Treponema sp.]|nr:hypothetical protein [Treponema sp.]
MLPLEKEKDALIKQLSDRYAQNGIGIDEYERLVEYINKIETTNELTRAEKLLQEPHAIPSKAQGNTHAAVFSWSSSHLNPVRGRQEKYLSIFGANRIMLDQIPPGKTVLQVSALCGLTEIIVSQPIKIINHIVPVCSGVFIPPNLTQGGDGSDDTPELYIQGKAVFSCITIISS